MNYFSISNYALLLLSLSGIVLIAFSDLSSRIRFRGNASVFSILMLFSLLILREKGWDLQLYKNIFNDVKEIGFGGWIEPGFQFLILAVKSVDGTFFVFNILFSLIICCFLHGVVKNDLRYASIAVMMFVFLYYFRGPYGQIRQALAMLIFLYSIRYVIENKTLYIFWNIVALMFHSVSNFAFVFLIIANVFTLTKKRYLYIFLIFSICYVLNGFNSLLDVMLSLGGNPLLMKVKFYLENANVTGGWLTPDFFRICVISVLILSIMPDFDKLNRYRKILILSFLVGSCLYMLLSFDLRLASRSSRVFLIAEFLIIAMLFEYVSNKGRLLFFMLLYGVLFLGWEFFIMSKAEVIYSWS